MNDIINHKKILFKQQASLGFRGGAAIKKTQIHPKTLFKQGTQKLTSLKSLKHPPIPGFPLLQPSEMASLSTSWLQTRNERPNRSKMIDMIDKCDVRE